MSQSQAETAPTPPRDLDVSAGVERMNSPRARLVYVYLSAVREASVDDLCTSLDMSRLTTFALLRDLEAAGLVTESRNTYRTVPN